MAREGITLAEQPCGEAQQGGEEELEDSRGGSELVREIQKKHKIKKSTHLLKLFHGEHLFGELQNQIMPHSAPKYLIKKISRESARKQRATFSFWSCL